MEECMSLYHVQLEEKALQVTTGGQGFTITTDRELLKKILDNLFANAVCFTPEGGKIEVIYGEKGLCIINYGVTVDQELLPHVFDPFVTSITKNKGHGLGLYVVSYYAKVLHFQVFLHNIDDGVMAELICMQN
jgi:signal transduction histidine kinase